MIEPARAVFLSYASQDAEAARRIADTLRSAGVEVWFDQSELRGGDVWTKEFAIRYANVRSSSQSSRPIHSSGRKDISGLSGGSRNNART
jgi:hypothetical protein